MAEEKEMPSSASPLALGQYLADLRVARRMTLREVEDATDKAVSNAYLSQLEHGKIAKPSPNVLHRLAAVYRSSYEILMEKAGYIMAPTKKTKGEKHGTLATFATANLTREEEESLLAYLAFLRSRK